MLLSYSACNMYSTSLYLQNVINNQISCDYISFTFEWDEILFLAQGEEDSSPRQVPPQVLKGKIFKSCNKKCRMTMCYTRYIQI